MIKLRFKPGDVWKPFYLGDWDEAILIGGRGSGKTWNAGNFCALETFKNPNYRTLVLRDVSSSINQSILQNIKSRFQFVMAKLEGSFDSVFEIQENQIKNLLTGDVNVFTKGFRQSRVEQQADLKGFEDMDLAIIEEAEDLRDEDRVNTLLDTLRKTGHKVIIILNTPDLEHWIVKKYFDYENSEFPELYKLKPKKINRVLQVVTSYKDNHHLPKQTVAKYDSYNDPDSYNYNPRYYGAKILGLASETQNQARKFDTRQVLDIKTKQPIKTVSGVKQFRNFDASQTYSIGIDGSSGLGNDFTGLTIRGIKKINGQYPLYAQMKAKVQTKQTAIIAINLYNQIKKAGGRCLLIPERNSLGDTIVQYLRDYINEDDIYSEMSKPTSEIDRPIRKFGYFTSSANRSGSDPYLVDKMANLFENGELEILNEDERQEMLKFIWNDDNRRYEAQAGSHDDLLLSDMLCLQGFDYILKS